MDEAIVERWNDAVADRDMVWVLGDVAMGTRRIGIVSRLKGRKVLVAGNHDSCWVGHKRWRRAEKLYLEAGFGHVYPSGQVAVRTQDGTDVLLSHLPYRGDSHAEDRYADRRPVDEGLPLICGHVHEKWKARGRMLNVGVDQWDFRPVLEETVLAELAALTDGDSDE